jgi:hypothetical protein
MLGPNYDDPVEAELSAAVERAKVEFDEATPENREERKQRLREALHAFQRYIDQKLGAQ